MKRLVLVAVLVLVATVGYRTYLNEETGTGDLTLPQPAPSVGAPAPEFTATATSGGEFTLTDDGVYVLAFRSTLNRASQRARPGFAEIARDFESSEITFATVYLSSAPRMEDAPYTMIRDSSGELASLYNVKRVPRLFVIQDSEIKLVLREDADRVREELARITGKRAIETTARETPPQG